MRERNKTYQRRSAQKTALLCYMILEGEERAERGHEMA